MLSVLRKGLKFSPIPGEPEMGKILDDIGALFHRMKLRAHYNDPEELDITVGDNSQPTIEQPFNIKHKPRRQTHFNRSSKRNLLLTQMSVTHY